MVIGVIIDNIGYEESKIDKSYSPKPIPKDLIEAWKGQLFDFQPVDVEFSVRDEKFYACSSILSKRSEYFERILSGQWSETKAVQRDNNDFDFNNDNKLTHQIKHRIEISEYDPITFSIMLEYLYTDQVRWTDKDNNSITVELFRLADKYLLSDLRERAKFRILAELNPHNASGIIFNLTSKYEDLRKPVLKFMAKNFEEINNSQEFKDILANLVIYPNYNLILSEILTEYFKIQKSNR